MGHPACLPIASLLNLGVRAWICQKGNQTAQWQTEKGQRDKQRSTKHYTEN